MNQMQDFFQKECNKGDEHSDDEDQETTSYIFELQYFQFGRLLLEFTKFVGNVVVIFPVYFIEDVSLEHLLQPIIIHLNRLYCLTNLCR